MYAHILDILDTIILWVHSLITEGNETLTTDLLFENEL